MRGEGISRERVPEFGGRRKKTNIMTGDPWVSDFHTILVTGGCLPSISWPWEWRWYTVSQLTGASPEIISVEKGKRSYLASERKRFKIGSKMMGIDKADCL